MTDIAEQQWNDTDVDTRGDGGLTVSGLSCGSCGTELPPNSKFCNECGAPVTATTRPVMGPPGRGSHAKPELLSTL